MSTSSSAQQARAALAARLRDIRLDSGMSARAVAAGAGWHESKSSRLESGKKAPSDADIQAWCRVCGAEDQVPDLIAQSRAADRTWTGWRQLERGGLRRLQEATVPIWNRTKAFRIYSPWLIPGPLQTAGYIRALLEQVARQSAGGMTGLDEAVSVRLAKQQVAHSGGRRFAVLLEESAVRSRIGPPEVVAEQLTHLLTAMSWPAISVGIIPQTADRSEMTAVEGFFLFDDQQVNVELVSGWLRVTTPSEIAMYGQTFAELTSLAVFGADARQIIASTLSDLTP